MAGQDIIHVCINFEPVVWGGWDGRWGGAEGVEGGFNKPKNTVEEVATEGLYHTTRPK